jgi:predicted nucleic acid-binding protein
MPFIILFIHVIVRNKWQPFCNHIFNFIKEYASVYISDRRIGEIEVLSNEIILTGIKKKDAVHLACSIIAECSYFITTDKQVLNFQTDKIKILNPVDFAEIWRKML